MNPTSVATRRTCRACGTGGLTPILSLGSQRLGGAFALNDERAVSREVPLELVRCDPAHDERACGLVQLRHTVPARILYDRYSYRSGVNQTMTGNLHQIARQAEAMAGLECADLVVDIGCNDGTLLDGYGTGGIQRLGFEPSSMAEHALRKGYEVVRDFYSADALRFQAKVITSIAMLYDLEDPAWFVDQVRRALAPDGVWVAELHYLPAMLETVAFDAIVHEHLAYYSLAVLERLLSDAGLKVVRAERNEINGGSVRLFIRHQSFQCREEPGVHALRVAEFELALDTPGPYQRFARDVGQIKRDLHNLCGRLADEGKLIHVYGASTKGNTILQHAGLGPATIPFAADRNPDKHGSRTATGIPIISEEESRAMDPDYYLALPWHFMAEFYERERAFLDRGGEFIVPLPHVHTVSNGRLE